MDEQQLIVSIESRLQAVFAAYQQGKDVPPCTLFRLEGVIEAACLMGFLTHQQANDLITVAWTAHFGVPVPSLSDGEIVIPTMMHRAPVVPSTSV
jgi:hypothetical protein